MLFANIHEARVYDKHRFQWQDINNVEGLKNTHTKCKEDLSEERCEAGWSSDVLRMRFSVQLDRGCKGKWEFYFNILCISKEELSRLFHWKWTRK
jgi:hypothetical protein